MPVSLLLILVLFVLAAWLRKRYLPLAGKTGPVKVVGVSSVRSRERVVVVEVESTWPVSHHRFRGVGVLTGMVMVPPQMVSLPLKLPLFVMAEGWHLQVDLLVASFCWTACSPRPSGLPFGSCCPSWARSWWPCFGSLDERQPDQVRASGAGRFRRPDRMNPDSSRGVLRPHLLKNIKASGLNDDKLASRCGKMDGS